MHNVATGYIPSLIWFLFEAEEQKEGSMNVSLKSKQNCFLFQQSQISIIYS